MAEAQLLPALVTLAALAMSLEILRRLLLARCAAAALLAAVWGAAFPRELQLRAALGALLYHGGAELLRARRARRRRRLETGYDDDDDRADDDGDRADDSDAISSSRSSGGTRDRRVIRCLLFLMRVFVWGATLAMAAGVSASSAADDSARVFVVRWWNAAVRAAAGVGALAGYCEALEVLVLRYFADQEVPYRWPRRAPLWALSSAVAALDAAGLLPLVARRLLAGVSPLGLVGVLAAGMWASVQLPWRCHGWKTRREVADAEKAADWRLER